MAIAAAHTRHLLDELVARHLWRSTAASLPEAPS